MKTASVREMRAHLADHLDGSEPVVVTRNGRHAGVLLPIEEVRRLPLQYRRKLFAQLANEMAKQLGTQVTDEEIERDFRAHRKNRRR